jgi:O-antigen/teichoic acid export membrane protein
VGSLLSVVTLVATPLFTLGFGASIGVCYGEAATERAKHATIWTAAGLLLPSAALLLLVGTLSSATISQLMFRTDAHARLVMITLAGAAASVLAMPLLLALQLSERAKAYVSVTLISTAVTAGATVYLVVSRHVGITGVVVGTAIGQAVQLVLLLPLVYASTQIAATTSIAKRLLLLGIPFVPSFAFLFLITQGNRPILERLQGLETVGVYTVGANLGLAMSLFVASFQSAWTPFFLSFAKRQDEARDLFGHVLTYYVFVFGSLGLLFAIAAKPVVMLLVPESYVLAHQAIGLSATAQVLLGAWAVLLPAVYFAGDVPSVTLIQAAAAVLSIICNVVLIPPLGVLGAAIGVVTGPLMMVVLQVAWNSRHSAYFMPRYEPGRLARFGVMYATVLTLMLLPRNLGIRGEIVLSCAAAMLLAPLLWLQLSSVERTALREFAHGSRTSLAALVGRPLSSEVNPPSSSHVPPP